MTPPQSSSLHWNMIRPRLRCAIKVSFLLFSLNLLLYIFNPYYLLRPLQIEQFNNVKNVFFTASTVSKDSVPPVVLNLLKIPNSPERNFSTTRETRVKLFLEGNGNCSQQSSGLGELLRSNYNLNYSIVHFLPTKGLFEGRGHSILNVMINDSHSFLVDPILKLIPIMEDEKLGMRLMNFQDLHNSAKIYQMNVDKEVSTLNNEYWTSNFTVVFTEVSQIDMEKYYRTTESLLGLLGLKDDSEFKRKFVNGVAVMFGDLPTFRVSTSEYEKLLRAYPSIVYLRYLGYFFLYNFYFLIVMVIMYVIKFKLYRVR